MGTELEASRIRRLTRKSLFTRLYSTVVLKYPVLYCTGYRLKIIIIKGLDSVDDRVEIVRVKLLSYISYYVKYTRLDPKNQSTKKT